MVTATAEPSSEQAWSLMEAVVERRNMHAALARVRRNGGAAGIDKMPVSALADHLREHWPQIKEQLLSGSYRPQPVRRVDIPKPGGSETRMLGIPTVLGGYQRCWIV
jgi:RNA-directed DNA polymerase